MTQRSNQSKNRGNIAWAPASTQAIVETLESRQLFSGATGIDAYTASLESTAATVVSVKAPAKHVERTAPSAAMSERTQARIAKEIANFTTHLHHEVARHPAEVDSVKFQQHIAAEQAKFARQVARKGGTYTPIPFAALVPAASMTPAVMSALLHEFGSGITSTSDSVIVPFTSPSPTPTIAAPTLTGKAASASSAGLSWTAITGASSYSLQTSANSGSSWTTLLNSTATTFTQTGLSADTTYTYRISTVEGTKSSAPSSVLTLTTYLAAPNGVAVATKSATENDLTWAKVPDATSYKLERSPDNTNWTTLSPSTALTAASISYADTTAFAGTTYYYRVSAIDAVGTSAASTVVHAMTLPPVPALTAKVISTSEIDLSWFGVTGATAYNLQRSLDGGASWSTLQNTSAITFANTMLSANTTYEYRISATDAGGSSATSSPLTDTTYLPAPTGLAAMAASATSINLTWASDPGATSYKLERSPNNTTWTALAPSPALTGASIGYTDTGVTTGATFYYRISAIDAVGTSSASSVANALTYTTAPTVTAVSKSASEIDLSWGTAVGATSYTLQTSVDGGNTWTGLTTANTNTYQNTTLGADTNYKYRVVSIDTTGSSTPGAVASATTYLAPPTGLALSVASATEIDLSWNAVADATSYKIERSPDNTAWTALAPSPALTGASITYANTALTAGSTYYYRISAINSVGTSVASTVLHTLTVPGAPTLTATASSVSQVNLSWTAPTSATSYVLQDSTDGGNTWTSLVTQATLSYSNTNLAADSSYKYRVTAIDATGSSVTSAVATALTLPVAPTGLTVTPVSPTVIDLSWNAKGDATNYKIERSPDNTAWTALAPSPALTGTSSTYVDTGLTAGNTYYYRISTIGPSGTSSPATAMHAQTYSNAPTLAGKIISASEIDLSWNAPASATSYKLESSRDGSSWTTLNSPTTTSYNNTNLMADTTYYYRVSALNPTGTSAISNVVNDTTIPAAPTGVAATEASATEIDITWSAVPDATNYKIERSPDGTAWTTLTLNPALTSSSVRYADTGVTSGATFYYRVSAIDASGTSVASSVAHTQSVPGTPTLTPTVTSASQISLVWTTVANATSYILQRSTDGGFTWTGAVTQATLSYVDSNLAADTAYKYRVEANDASGSGAFSTVVGGTTLENPPTGLAANVHSGTEIDLTWSPIADATSYKLEKSTNAGTTWTPLVPSPALTGSSSYYADTAVTAGSTDYYRISAISASGTSVPSSTVHLTTPPNATTLLTATDVSASVVNLAWAACATATGYLITISSDGGTIWSQEALPPAAAVTYVATGLSSDTAYKFKVYAMNAGGSSAASNAAMATTLLAPPVTYTSSFTTTPFSTTRIDLAWSAVTDATSYSIQRSSDNINWGPVTPGTPFTGASTSYNDTGLTAGTTYYYRLSAVDAAGPSVPTPVDVALTIPAAPMVTATPATLSQINVSWPAVAGASSYIVSSSPDGSTWTPLVTQAGTTYQNTSLSADTEYYYQVTAVNATGDSAASMTAMANTTLAAPTGFGLTVASANEIDLAWTAVSDATSYSIQRSTNGTTWTTLNPSPSLNSTSSSYADTTVAAGTTYYYSVYAVDAAGTSAGATTQSALTVPATPTLTASVASSSVVNLSWTAVKAVTNYVLQNSPDGTNWTSIATQTGTTYSNTNLTADTAYYYQVMALDATGGGAANSPVMVTTRLAAPSGLTPTAASAGEIDLTWTSETGATNYIIQRSTNNTVWTTLVPSPALTSASTSYADTSVLPGSTYYYTIIGVDASGNSAPAATQMALTQPAVPNLTATVASASSVNLAWNAVKGATSYIVQNSPDGTNWAPIATQAGTSYTNSMLSGDTQYYYQVMAVDATGDGAPNTAISVTTLLAAPSGLGASASSSTEIDLTWTSETDATTYLIQRSTNGTLWTTLTPSPALTSASTSYADTSVLPGTTYYYSIKGVDAVGASAPAGTQTALTVPGAPALTATVASANSVNLTWGPVTGATSYVVANSPDGTNWTPISTQAGTSYTNSMLSADTAYYYQVTPLDATGGGVASNNPLVTTLLAAPSPLTTMVASANEIDLSWTAETDATTYTIQRSTNQTVWTTLTPSPALNSASTSYADTSVAPGTTYYYRLFSLDLAGTSAAATSTASTVPATPTLNATVASAGSVNLAWTAAKGATAYVLQGSPDGSTWTPLVTQAGTTYTNTSLTADTAYYYQVMGVDSTGTGAANTASMVTTFLAAPSGLAASVASANEVDLTWSSETDATNYVIQRSVNGTVWTTLAPNPALTSASTSYADTTAQAGTSYYYSITSVNAHGSSAPATSVPALTVPATPTLAATVTSANQVNLVWTPELGATLYKLQSSPDGSTWTTIATQAGTTYSNTMLTGDTLYQYQVIPIDTTGPGAPSSTVMVTTPLAPPSGFTVTAASATENDLAWTSETDATNYEIDRSTNNTLWTPLAPNPALTSASTSYADTTAVAGTTYYYRIEGINANGTSAPAMPTPASTLTLPATPALVATPVLSSEIVLTWAPVASATSYTLSSSPDGSMWTALATQAGTTYANTNLAADTAYYYEVAANNATGAGATTVTPVMTKTLLAAPTGFATTAASDVQVDLTWNAVTDATGYQIEVSTDQTAWTALSPSPALTSSSTMYNDAATPQPGVMYYYRIEAINALGISVPSTAVPITMPLAAPTGLAAAPAGASQINLTWTADTATGLTGYLLQYSTDNTNWFNDITISSTSTSISDVRLTASTEYYYRLLAVNAGGNSAPGNVVNATTTAM